MGARSKIKIAHWLEDIRHRLLHYPVDGISISRLRVYDEFEQNSAIPKVIVQTARNPQVARPIASAVRRWQEMNPEFDYEFFDDDSARQFIEQFYPKEVIVAFDTLRPGAYRADLWRYCYLARNGGVYVDIRMEPLVALRSILDLGNTRSPCIVAVADKAKNAGPGNLYNAFIAVSQNHPFITATIERALRCIAERNYGRNALDVTGPGCFGAAVNLRLGRQIDATFDPGDWVHPEFGVIRILSHRDDPYHRSIVALENSPVIRTKCIHGPMVNADRTYLEPHYLQLYKQRAIFR